MPSSPDNKRPFYTSLIAAAIIIALSTAFHHSNPIGDATRDEFKTMLLDGDVKSVKIMIKQHRLEVTLHPVALYKPSHQAKLRPTSSIGRFLKHNRLGGLDVEGPHYHIKLAHALYFDQVYAGWKKELPIKSWPRYEINNEYSFYNILALLPWGTLLFILFLFYLYGGFSEEGLFGIGKARFMRWDNKKKKVGVTFDDVAGMKEAKQEVKEFVDFLKDPSHYKKLGGRIPRGALLAGPPGTGKTLLAKAVAGEAGVTFLSMPSTGFSNMYVGVGAERVRSLFKEARKLAPCIIFIDEIDSIGGSRGFGHSSRDLILNALLEEMDGMGTEGTIVVFAATNRSEVLDDALIRAGRFDRIIDIGRPTKKEREETFGLYLKKIAVDKSVDPSQLARQTAGFTGADIAQVCNEAALLAGRRGGDKATYQDMQDAIDRSIGGIERKTRVISPKEKKIVAYHEAGHTVAAWYTKHAAPLVKVSIIPRGANTLGYAQYEPQEIAISQKEEIIAKIDTLNGGRAAEEIQFKTISTGAWGDLRHSTKIVYSMLLVYGMNDRVGSLAFRDLERYYKHGFSQTTLRIAEEEARKLAKTSYQRVLKLLKKYWEQVEILAQHLLEKEVLEASEVAKLLGPRPFPSDEEHEDQQAKEAAPSIPQPQEETVS